MFAIHAFWPYDLQDFQNSKNNTISFPLKYFIPVSARYQETQLQLNPLKSIDMYWTELWSKSKKSYFNDYTAGRNLLSTVANYVKKTDQCKYQVEAV